MRTTRENAAPATRSARARRAVVVALCVAPVLVLGCASTERTEATPEPAAARRAGASALVFPGPFVWDVNTHYGLDHETMPEYARRDVALSVRQGETLLGVTAWPAREPEQEPRRIQPIWSRWGRSF